MSKSLTSAQQNWVERASSPGPEVRKAVASDELAPAEALSTLVGDRVWAVRWAAASNPNAPQETLNLLRKAGADRNLLRAGLPVEYVTDEGYFDLMRVLEADGGLKTSNQPQQTLTDAERQRLIELGSFGRQLVAIHPETPPDQLCTLAADDDPHVHRALEQNPNAPSEES